MINHGIHDPIQPELTDPLPHDPTAGNPNDDDGVAIDEMFEAAPQGPIEYGLILPDIKNELPTTTRLITRRVNLFSLNDATPDTLMIFPADPNRRDLIIQVFRSGVINTYLSVTSDAMLNAAPLSPLGSGAQVSEWRSDKHTGPVYVSLICITGEESQTAEVSAWSVTT